MAASQSQLKASKKYQQKFERLQIRVTPEEKKIISDCAESAGESLNTFVRRAVLDAVDRDQCLKKEDN